MGGNRWVFRVVCMALLLSACSPAAALPTPVPDTPPPPTATLAPTTTDTPPPAPTATATRPPIRFFSPLENVSLAELPQIVTNPFVQPTSRLDDGHHGVDLAFYRFKDMGTIEGLPIHSVLSGTVAAVVNDRLPYGNMIIIETPLRDVPPAWIAANSLPQVIPTVTSDGRLSCPETGLFPAWDTSNRSLYLAYGHMFAPTPLKLGEAVQGNAVIGAVGNTGHSSNPHLHLEVRIGPAGARFEDAIAHKETTATAQEMFNYCLWRISSTFQTVDPIPLLLLPQ